MKIQVRWRCISAPNNVRRIVLSVILYQTRPLRGSRVFLSACKMRTSKVERVQDRSFQCCMRNENENEKAEKESKARDTHVT